MLRDQTEADTYPLRAHSFCDKYPIRRIDEVLQYVPWSDSPYAWQSHIAETEHHMLT